MIWICYHNHSVSQNGSDCRILWPDFLTSPISPVCRPVPEPDRRKLAAFAWFLQSERQFAIIVLISIPCAVKISYLFNVAFPKFEKIKKVEWKVCDWTVHLWIQFQATTQNFRIDGKYQKVLISLSPTIKMWKTSVKWKMFDIFLFLFSSHCVVGLREKK